jgi:hypothetical protein
LACGLADVPGPTILGGCKPDELWNKCRSLLNELSPYFCPKFGLSLVEKGIGDAPNLAQKSAHRFLA